MDLTERTIESKTMFQGRIITVLLDTAGLPDGGTAQREVVLHPGGVAILALDEADNVALVRQYRYPLHGLLLELPAGKLDPGEDHRPRRPAGAERGDRPGGGGTDLSGPYLCLTWLLRRGAAHVSGPGPDPRPAAPGRGRVSGCGDACPLTQLVEQVMSGEITDAKTVATVLKVKTLLGLLIWTTRRDFCGKEHPDRRG